MTRRGPVRPASTHPTVYLDDGAILREVPFIRNVLKGASFREDDVEDICQEVLIGAWRSMSNGRFRPDPRMPLASALRVWLVGIAFRQGTHYRERAFRRREYPRAKPWAGQDEPVEFPSPRHDAREELRALARLRPMDQRVLILTAQGVGMAEMARRLGCPAATAAHRIRRARERFTRIIARMRR